MSFEAEFQRGAFLTMKHARLVAQSDIDVYDTQSYNILKSQGVIMLFSTYWARMLEIGNVVPGFKTYKYGYYGFFISVPAILHAIYAGHKFNSEVEKLDRKYSTPFLQYKNSKKKEIDNIKPVLSGSG